MGCPICKPPPSKAKIYTRGDGFFITRCGKCKVPMLVARNHKTESDFTEEQIQGMIARCTNIASIVYPYKYWELDTRTEHWPDHLHWHIRLVDKVIEENKK